MTDYLHIQLPPDQIRGISSIGLAHMGDAVYELLVRTWLCAVEDGQCDERNPNPCHADAQVQGDALAHAGEPTALPGAHQRHARGQQWFGR